MKLILWLVLIVVVIHLLRRKKVAPPRAENTRPRESEVAELMVCCAHCGIHLPVSEAVTSARGVTFCSAAHRALQSSS